MRLAPRERLSIALGGVAVFFALFYLVVYEPAMTGLENTGRKIEVQQKRYQEVLTLAKEYGDIRQTIAVTEKRFQRPRSFSLLSHIEGLAVKNQVKDKMVQMKPKQGQTTRFYRENSVELKIEKAALPLLVQFMHDIENSPELLKIKEMKLRPRFDNKNLIDALIQVSAFELVEPAQ
jgi:general secretion pathway protein M